MSSQPFLIYRTRGTGSARAALLSSSGDIKATFTQDTKTWRDPNDSDIFEQSTTDIWNAISACTRAVLKDAGVDPSLVKGIGFDATCSLAVGDLQGNPITVTRGSDLGNPGDRDVILWADHRAQEEARLINASGSNVLKFVGGTMSVCHIISISGLASLTVLQLEMEIPKTLWLKNHMAPERFAKCQFFDLPDFCENKLI